MDFPAMSTGGQADEATRRRSVPSGEDPIYVDVSALEERNLTGMGRFVAHLVQALAQFAPLGLLTTKAGQYIRIQKAGPPRSGSDVECWARRLLRRPRQALDGRSARNCAVVYTALRPPVRRFRREIGILYDFTTLLLPWTHGPGSREHFGAFFAHTSQLCHKLVAISQSTKRDAQWLCSAHNEDVVVGYPGPSLCSGTHAHPRPVARRANMILVVSALEPRKNAPFLLDWFASTDTLDPDMELWWVGPKAWWASQDLIRSLQRRRNGRRGTQVKLLGKVSDPQLCALYRQAAFTIYPSLYEGFGLPVLDSLMHGTPVLCSYHSSLQELAGPGLFYFDACDPSTLDAACCELRASQPVEIDTAALRRRFSWERLAQTVKVLCA
jgi:glycosyltransferase involved in cell wall biosynthesis